MVRDPQPHHTVVSLDVVGLSQYYSEGPHPKRTIVVLYTNKKTHPNPDQLTRFVNSVYQPVTRTLGGPAAHIFDYRLDQDAWYLVRFARLPDGYLTHPRWIPLTKAEVFSLLGQDMYDLPPETEQTH